MYIGVTGQIGSGKTTAARILGSFGAVVIDADRIGREVVEKSPQLRRKLAKQFGKEILTATGRLSRKKLARLAFSDDVSKRRLNHLVHPMLLKELRRQMRQLSRRYDVVVIDAALLLDWNLDREMDLVLVIHATQETRLRRLVARGFSKEDVLARQRAQLPFTEFRNRADLVILNNNTLLRLKARLRFVWDTFVAKSIDR
ncbi:MAG: dephospho-CoA kinase [Candidatus Zixiibacteriota bacterium]